MKATRQAGLSLVAAALTFSGVAVPVVYVPTAIAQAVSKADQVRSMNGQLLKAQSDLRRAQSPAQADAAKANAAKILAARAAALNELIASSPAQADALAFPASVLEQLADSFPEAAVNLEERGRWVGKIEYTIEDAADMKSSKSAVVLKSDIGDLVLKFSGREPPGLMSGQKVAVGGVRSGKSVVAAETQIIEAALDGTSTTTATSGTAVCSATGPQSIVSILVNLPGYKLPTNVTQDFIRGKLLGNAYAGTAQASPDLSVDDFWQQNSDGKTYVDAVNTTVVGPVTLTSNFNTDSTGASYCDHHGLRDAAMRAVDSQVDFRRYSRVEIVMPANGACGWAGKATMGCTSLSTTGDGSFTASPSWQRADQMSSRKTAVMLAVHEMGHNLGLHHGTSRDFGSEALGALGAAGTSSEYGDSHSTMGYWNLGFYASSHAANQLGWLSAGSGYLTVESSGTYTISNYEARGGALRALKVRRGTGNDAWLWIESRQNVGLYSSTLNSSLFGGALIHYQDSSTASFSNLLDYTTGTSAFSDAALLAGSTWTDPYSNVSVTVNSVTPGAMTVTVNYSGVTCTTAAPTVTASPTSVATPYGTSTVFNVTVKNNSSSGCPAETYGLSAVVPSGWSTAFAASSLSVSPGQQAQTSLNIGVPAPYALGTYAVSSAAKSSASGKSSSGTENVTVTEPTYRLSLGVSGSGSVAFSTPSKTCSSSCNTDYPVSQATTVTLTAKPGSRATFAGWSGACTGTSLTCTVSVNKSLSVSAVFQNGRKK